MHQLPLAHQCVFEAIVLLLRRVLRAHALAAPPTAAANAAAADADVDSSEPRRTALASQLASLFAEAMLRAPPRAAASRSER